MTREEVINELKDNLNPYKPPASPKAISTAISLLEKENEPAPLANDTSSNKKYSKENDSTEKEKCQEEIAEVIENMLDIYNIMTPEEQNAWKRSFCRERHRPSPYAQFRKSDLSCRPKSIRADLLLFLSNPAHSSAV